MQTARRRYPFVVQEHHEGSNVHWDLMLHRPVDSPDGENFDEKILATWKLPVFPLPASLDVSILIPALPDHRRIYLTYEGSISHNRGWCKIVDRGNFELLEYLSDFWRVIFTGKILVGRFDLKKIQDPDRWILVNSGSIEYTLSNETQY